MKKSKVFVIAGPSGTGKDSVINGLKKIIPFKQLITTVSRPMRSSERQGKPYYFISKKQFEKNIKQNKFFEYDFHYKNYYGLTNDEIKKIKKDDKIYLWQTEYEGVKTIKKKMSSVTTIFINSPVKILIDRMRRREVKFNKKNFLQRIKDIKLYLKHLDIFDYVIENKEGELDNTINKVAKIIKHKL